MTSSAMEKHIGKIVVLDTGTTLMYIGNMASIDTHFITMNDVDVHDRTDAGTTKEQYLIDAVKYGVKKNRKSVIVKMSEVISVSLLEDIIQY